MIFKLKIGAVYSRTSFVMKFYPSRKFNCTLFPKCLLLLKLQKTEKTSLFRKVHIHINFKLKGKSVLISKCKGELKLIKFATFVIQQTVKGGITS